MADPTSDGTFVGLFMVEQPPGWWLPPGFTSEPDGHPPLLASDPAGNQAFVYPVPGHQPSPEQVDSVANVIERELGPVPSQGLGPDTYKLFGADGNTPLGLINQAVLYPIDKAALLLHLANYGIDAAIVGGTEVAARRGWMTQTSAGQLRRDLMLLSLVLGAEAGRAPEVPTQALRTAAGRTAMAARAAAGGLPPVVLRVERATGLPFGRVFRVVDVAEAESPTLGVPTLGRPTPAWLVRLREGRAFDRDQADQYRFNQIYVVKDSGKGYWVLDSYGPRNAAFGAGPVSRKFTQLADIQVKSAIDLLREAHRKYRPGTKFADVRSRPEELANATVQGQLWLEVPIQKKPIPAAVLATARQLSIKIRDVTGKVYQ